MPGIGATKSGPSIKADDIRSGYALPDRTLRGIACRAGLNDQRGAMRIAPSRRTLSPLK